MNDQDQLVRLGFDLHDGPLQDAAFLVGHVQALREELEEGAPRAHLLESADNLSRIGRELERALRQLSVSLTSGAIPSKRFDVALAEAIARFESRSGLHPEISLAGPLGAVAHDLSDALVYATGEALENVRKHSGADHVWVRAAAGTCTEVEIRDDGVGFDTRASSDGLGLRGMSERMRICGGRMTIVSRRGAGTTVRLSV